MSPTAAAKATGAEADRTSQQPPDGAPSAAAGALREDALRRLLPIAEEFPFEPRFFAHPATPSAPPLHQHYVDEGPRDAEPLLFVHGNPTWSFAWRRAIRSLGDRYRCVAVDHVGCGLSERGPERTYRLRDHAERLERLVLGLDLRRITLVLHDWGGAIGMAFARRHPERVARLVLLNTAAFPSERMPLRIALCRLPLLGRLAVRGLNGFARAATFMAVERPLSAPARRGLLLPYDSWRQRAATHAFVLDIPMDAGHPSWDELQATADAIDSFRDRPTMLLWGERDWCFTPAFREEWRRRLPGAEERRFEAAGHYVFEDAGEELVDELAAFLERHPLEARP